MLYIFVVNLTRFIFSAPIETLCLIPWPRSNLIPRVGDEAFERVRRATSRDCDWRWCSFGRYYGLKCG